jgi:hypothetical protein
MNIKISEITQNADGTIAFNFAPDNSGTDEGDNTEYSSDEPEPAGDPLELPFTETFALCTGAGGNDGTWSGNVSTTSIDGYCDNSGWTWVTENESVKAYAASGCAKIGTNNVVGWATTPVLAINGTAKLTFKAGAFNNTKSGTKLSLTVAGGTIDPASVTMTKGAFNEFTASITAAGNATITFTQEKGSFFLDDVTVASTSSGIQSVNNTLLKANHIYTIDGRYVGTDPNLLPRGLYIVNGKKIVK